MKAIITSPGYLIRNPYGYCFQMVVPVDLQGFVGKIELRYSLKTGYLGRAKNKARYLAGQVASRQWIAGNGKRFVGAYWKSISSDTLKFLSPMVDRPGSDTALAGYPE